MSLVALDDAVKQIEGATGVDIDSAAGIAGLGAGLDGTGQLTCLIFACFHNCGAVADGQGEGIHAGGDNAVIGRAGDSMAVQTQIQIAGHDGLIGQGHIGVQVIAAGGRQLGAVGPLFISDHSMVGAAFVAAAVMSMRILRGQFRFLALLCQNHLVIFQGRNVGSVVAFKICRTGAGGYGGDRHIAGADTRRCQGHADLGIAAEGSCGSTGGRAGQKQVAGAVVNAGIAGDDSFFLQGQGAGVHIDTACQLRCPVFGDDGILDRYGCVGTRIDTAATLGFISGDLATGHEELAVITQVYGAAYLACIGGIGGHVIADLAAIHVHGAVLGAAGAIGHPNTAAACIGTVILDDAIVEIQLLAIVAQVDEATVGGGVQATGQLTGIVLAVDFHGGAVGNSQAQIGRCYRDGLIVLGAGDGIAIQAQAQIGRQHNLGAHVHIAGQVIVAGGGQAGAAGPGTPGGRCATFFTAVCCGMGAGGMAVLCGHGHRDHGQNHDQHQKHRQKSFLHIDILLA